MAIRISIRRLAAGALVTVGLLLLGSTARRVQMLPAQSHLSTGRLEAALAAALPADAGAGAPTLLLLADTDCGACEDAREDLRSFVGPDDLGVRAVVLLRSEEDDDELFGHGLLPTYVLFDECGRFLGGIRGYRPPEAIRAWIRETLLASFPP